MDASRSYACMKTIVAVNFGIPSLGFELHERGLHHKDHAFNVALVFSKGP